MLAKNRTRKAIDFYCNVLKDRILAGEKEFSADAPVSGISEKDCVKFYAIKDSNSVLIGDLFYLGLGTDTLTNIFKPRFLFDASENAPNLVLRISNPKKELRIDFIDTTISNPRNDEGKDRIHLRQGDTSHLHYFFGDRTPPPCYKFGRR